MPERMSPFDYMMFLGEPDPRLRSTGMAVMILDRPPDWERLLRIYEGATRVVRRMRQRVVVPATFLGEPVWAIDPDFDLSYHVRRVQAPEPGTLPQLFALAQVMSMTALDPARPQWELTLVDGLEGGKAALITKMSHAITDGLGGVQLAKMIYDLERDAPDRKMPPRPIPEDVRPVDLTRDALLRLPLTLLGSAAGAAGTILGAGRALAGDPGGAAARAEAFVRSLGRVAAAPLPPPSPLMRRRSHGRRFHVWERPLEDLRRAAKAAGGSVNDVYLAAMAGGLRLYHERLGTPVQAVPIGMPISLRTESDAAGGNRWAAARFACPVGVRDPRERIARLRQVVLAVRDEPAVDAMNLVAPLVTRLPAWLVSGSLPRLDIQASNVPGLPFPGYIAGAEIERAYLFGPLPGAAIMAVLHSNNGICTFGVNVDPASITDARSFQESMEEGVAEVVALGEAPVTIHDFAPPPEPEPAPAPESPLVISEALTEVLTTVRSAPKGPRTGAFFDCDGTLIAGFTASVFAEDRFRQGEFTLSEMAETTRRTLGFRLGQSDFGDLIGLVAELWRGRSEEDLLQLGERLYVQRLADRVFPEARELVAAHREQGHTLVLTSSASRYQVEPIARGLGIQNVISTRFEVADGVLTGKLAEDPSRGAGKANKVQALAAELGLDLEQSFFYADGDDDVALMHLVGRPHPVNPEPRMAATAARRGWPLLHFSSRGSLGVSVLARNAIATATAPVVGFLAAGAGILAADRRKMLDTFSAVWPDLFLRLTGVELRIAGREHLWSHRPAIFIFNHRNLIDSVIASALVERNFTGVGKKELESDPFVGWFLRLSDAVLVDRSDTEQAVAALTSLQEKVSRGLSIVIAPEGTRSLDGRLGKFKKGAFRMAMAAGVPIVPIVIRNVDSVAPRDSRLVRPGTVDVAILAPIPVADWTLEDLPERIEGVRRLYLETLAHWPPAPPHHAAA